MRPTLARRALMLAMIVGGFATPAAAQMYPGADVTVNRAAGGGRVLLYPGGQYMRVLPPLLQPGEPYPGRSAPPVHLHMPVHHAKAARKAPLVAERETAAEETEAAPSETTLAPLPPQARPVKRQAAAEPESSGAAAIPFSFEGQSTQRPKPAPEPPAQAAAKPRAVASAAPAPAITAVRGLARQAAILFDQSSTELSDASSARLRDLSSSLNAALVSGADRVELVGYGGTPGDKSSNARRLSLKRALAIREALIVDGLPANRIDVRALGGVEDNGPTDRVDIFVKG